MRILAIESSCDETAAAIATFTKAGNFKLGNNIVSSQIDIHAQYGGVIPEVAARSHILNILPVITQACGPKKPDYIAVTNKPGLITSLLVGVETAKALSYLWKIPLIAVDHMSAHLYANWLEHNKKIHFPVIGLIISGGHTELVLMKKDNDYKIIGSTRDDAVGEAFDKVAKILDLGYPGGPIVSRLAQDGNAENFDLPRPMINSGDFDFSFSGLKTAVLYTAKKYKAKKEITNDLCATFQKAAIEVLVSKTIKAAKKYKAKTILMGGGVACNQYLRQQLARSVASELSDTKFFYPSPKYCTDNAAMVAIKAYHQILGEKQFSTWQKIEVQSN